MYACAYVGHGMYGLVGLGLTMYTYVRMHVVCPLPFWLKEHNSVLVPPFVFFFLLCLHSFGRVGIVYTPSGG